VPAVAGVKRRPKFSYTLGFQLKLLRVLYQDYRFASQCSWFLSPKHFSTRALPYLAETILQYAQKEGHGIARDALRASITRARAMGRLQDDDVEHALQIVKGLRLPVLDKSFVKEQLAGFIQNQVIREMLLDSVRNLKKGDFAAIKKAAARVASADLVVMRGGKQLSLTEDVEERIKRRKLKEKDGIPTGTRCDDYIRAGGLVAGGLHVVVAAPNAGKSQILMHMGCSAIMESERQERVLFISNELQTDYVGDRADSWFSGVQVSALEKKPNTVRRAMRRLKKFHGDCYRIKEFIDEPVGVAQIEAYIKSLEAEGWTPTLVVIDYADELVDDEGAKYNSIENTYVAQGNIFRQLRRLANRLNVPILTASQTVRAADNKQLVELSDLGDSWNKAKVADFIVSFCQTKQEQQRGQARLYIIKNRFGAKGIELKIRVDWSRSKVRNL